MYYQLVVICMLFLSLSVAAQQRLNITLTAPTSGVLSISMLPPQQDGFYKICDMCLNQNYDPLSINQLCSNSPLQWKLSTECGIGKPNPFHMFPGSIFNVSVQYDANSSKLVRFALKFTPPLSNASSYIPVSGDLNAQAVGYSPFSYALQVPTTVSDFGLFYSLVQLYFINGTDKGLVYEKIVCNVTMDVSNKDWVYATSNLTFPTWAIAVVVGIACVLIGGAFWLFQRWKEGKKAQTVAPLSKPVTSIEPDEEEDNKAVVYRKSIDGNFRDASSQASRRSILKNRVQSLDGNLVMAVQDEPMKESKPRSQDAKRVFFKETVLTALVDLNQPPADDNVPPSSLFEDSDDDEDTHVVYFNDGGIEQNVRELLKRNAIEEAGDDTDSDVSDGWRKEE
ncbi:hypothetical protein HDU79_010948 [Rhizoclosmatium sp. JEL0117]|nr:hypothetical protein HDU79_010948 [Rhizoclosmatium sp. JEL0117]